MPMDFEITMTDWRKRTRFWCGDAAIDNGDVAYIREMRERLSPEAQRHLIKFAQLVIGGIGVHNADID